MKMRVAITLCIALLLSAACQRKAEYDDRRPGPARAESREFGGYNAVNAGSVVNLEISAQKDFGLEVEAPENFLSRVKTDVRGDTLFVSTGDLKPAAGKITVRIALPELKKLELWGASAASVDGVKTDALEIHVSGSSSLTIDGEVKSVKSSAIGASTIEASNLKAENASAKATGASTITLFAAEALDAEALGASSIYYLGDPKNVKSNPIGGSRIEKK